jgi:hypothetical protein
MNPGMQQRPGMMNQGMNPMQQRPGMMPGQNQFQPPGGFNNGMNNQNNQGW